MSLTLYFVHVYFIQDSTVFDLLCGSSSNNNNNGNNNNGDNNDNDNNNNDNKNNNEEDCASAISELNSDSECDTALSVSDANTSQQNVSAILCNAPCSTLVQTSINACTNVVQDSVS